MNKATNPNNKKGAALAKSNFHYDIILFRQQPSFLYRGEQS